MKIWKTFKAGLLWFSLIAVVVSLVVWVMSLLANFVIPFSPNKIINIPANLLAYAVLIWLVGWLIAKPAPRKFFMKLFSKIPLVSVVTDFFLNNDYIDKVTAGYLPEVFFKFGGEWTFGLAVNHLQLPAQMTEGELESWLIVIVPTTPIVFTGFPIFKPEREVIYTGRTFKNAVVACASFGLNFPQPDTSKFNYGKPPATTS